MYFYNKLIWIINVNIIPHFLFYRCLKVKMTESEDELAGREKVLSPKDES